MVKGQASGYYVLGLVSNIIWAQRAHPTWAVLQRLYWARECVARSYNRAQQRIATKDSKRWMAPRHHKRWHWGTQRMATKDSKGQQRMATRESKGWMAPRHHKGWH
eukprot:1157898-Pelagomonas_calceolata.AAC.2